MDFSDYLVEKGDDFLGHESTQSSKQYFLIMRRFQEIDRLGASFRITDFDIGKWFVRPSKRKRLTKLN